MGLEMVHSQADNGNQAYGFDWLGVRPDYDLGDWSSHNKREAHYEKFRAKYFTLIRIYSWIMRNAIQGTATLPEGLTSKLKEVKSRLNEMERELEEKFADEAEWF